MVDFCNWKWIMKWLILHQFFLVFYSVTLESVVWGNIVLDLLMTPASQVRICILAWGHEFATTANPSENRGYHLDQSRKLKKKLLDLTTSLQLTFLKRCNECPLMIFFAHYICHHVFSWVLLSNMNVASFFPVFFVVQVFLRILCFCYLFWGSNHVISMLFCMDVPRFIKWVRSNKAWLDWLLLHRLDI